MAPQPPPPPPPPAAGGQVGRGFSESGRGRGREPAVAVLKEDDSDAAAGQVVLARRPACRYTAITFDPGSESLSTLAPSQNLRASGSWSTRVPGLGSVIHPAHVP